MKLIPLLFGVPSALLAQVIAGTVTAQPTQQPLAKVSVCLNLTPTSCTATDSSGRFQFAITQLRTYTLRIYRLGYLNEERPVTPHDPSGLPNIRLSLIPQSVISGTVLDADGFPVAALIQTYNFDDTSQAKAVASTSSDDLGRFRLTKLPAGTYFLAVSPRQQTINWDQRYVRFVFPYADGQPRRSLDIQAGSELSGLTIAMPHLDGVTVSGRLNLELAPYIPQGSQPGFQLHSAGHPGLSFIASARNGATFVFRHVLPGTQVLQARYFPLGGSTLDHPPLAELRLDVGTTDIADLVLNPQPFEPHDIKGSLQFEDPAHAVSPILALSYIDSGGVPHMMRTIPIRADGSFLLESLPSARYRLARNPAQGPPFDAIVTLGDTELANGEFQPTGTASPALTVRILARTATLHANVTGSAGAAWGATVHVEPVNPAMLVKAGGLTDQDGDYRESLPPGQYRVWVATGSVQTVTLTAGASATVRLN